MVAHIEMLNDSDIIWPQLDEAVTRKLSTVQMVT